MYWRSWRWLVNILIICQFARCGKYKFYNQANIYIAYKSLPNERKYQYDLPNLIFISMLQTQTSRDQDQPYLQDGDWIQLQFEGLSLFSEGFKCAEVSMKANRDFPLLSLFIIQHADQSGKAIKKSIHFNQPIVLIHRLSSKYLSYTPNFASKSEFKLRAILTDHCQFTLKPLYKCQTLRGDLVRNLEQCSLTPANSMYAAQNINLVVGKCERNTLGKVPIFLKKNQFTALRMVRKNLEKKVKQNISNLLIYQLGHLQKKRWLCCERSKDKHFEINFTQNKGEYGTLLMIEQDEKSLEEQAKIKSGQDVAFKFIGIKKYLGFNEMGQVLLSGEKNEDTRFQIELYSKAKQLDINSLIKILHVKTNQYLSLSNNCAAIEEFNTFNIFELANLSPEDLKSNLFINEVYLGLQQQFNEISTSKKKRSMTAILKQIIKFIFRNKNIYQQYSSLQQIKHYLTEEQQNLFASIGFIDLLKDIAIYCFQEYQQTIVTQAQDKKNKSFQNINNEYNEQEHIYFQVCIILTGICKQNKSNISKFSQFLKIFYEHVGKIKASLQMLYHIFAFSVNGLEVLQSLQFVMKKNSVKALEFFCHHLFKRQFNIQSRTKFIKFFHGCIINSKNEKNYNHQQIMLSIVSENKLKNIMYSLSNNEDYDLIVNIQNQKEELAEIIEKQDTYELELELIYQQLDFLATLCSRASKKHVYLFRDIVSQEMVKKYLKLKLNSKFKSLFLKILVNIYLNKGLDVSPHALIVITNPKKTGFDQSAPFRRLSNLSSLSIRLLDKNAQLQMEQVNENKFKFIKNMSSLGEIKELIKKIIGERLYKNEIDSELISCLYSIYNFLQVGVCEQKEGDEIVRQLASYLSTHYQQNKDFNKQLLQKFIDLLDYSVESKIKIKITAFLLKIREGFKEGEERIKYSKKIINYCNQFMKEQLKQLLTPDIEYLLHKIIIFAFSKDFHQISLKSSRLFDRLKKVSFYFLESIKGVILIESDDSHESLKEINKIYNAITDYTIDYLYQQQNSQQVARLRKNIIKILQKAINLLQSCEEEEKVNILSQKIIGEFNFFEIIVQLIYQRQKDLQHPESNQLFSLLFKFIKLFLINSDQNFFRNAPFLLKIKNVFKRSDKGQIKLLWELTCMKIVSIRMNNFLFESYISALTSSKQHKFYIPLGFLKLILGKQAEPNHQQNIKLLVNAFLAEKSLLQNLLNFEVKNENILMNSLMSKEQWIFYLAASFKLLSFILQKSKEEKGLLIQCYKKYLSFKNLVRMIEQSFSMEFECSQKQKVNSILMVSFKLLKRQLLSIFEMVYLNESEIELEYILYVAQRIGIRLSAKNAEVLSDDHQYKQIIFYNKHSETVKNAQLKQGLIEYVSFDNKSHFEITIEVFHTFVNNTYIFINTYFTFMFRICQKIIELYLQNEDHRNITASLNTKEIEVFIQNVFKKYKQFIEEKLTYSEYVAYWKTYNSSIKSVEEIVKKKVNLGYNYQAHDDNLLNLMEGQEYFSNGEIEFAFKSFLQNKNKLEKYMYQAILIMVYNPNIQHIEFSETNWFSDHLKTIVNRITMKMKDQHHNFRQKCQTLYCYILMNKKNPEWPPSLEEQSILKTVASSTQDFNVSNLKYYLFTECKMLENYFQFQENHYKRYKKVEFCSSEQFLEHFNRFKEKLKGLIQNEKQLYSNKMLINQSKIYFQSLLLNYHIFPRLLSIQLILKWLLYKIKYNAQNIERYNEIIIEVFSLFKNYVQFIHEFDKKYISSELYNKLKLCLKIIFRSITGNNIKMLMILIEQEIWVEMNLLLSLNDTLQQNYDEMDLKVYDLIKLSSRIKIESVSSLYIQGVLQLFNNSLAIYGEHGEILEENQYPLVPAKSFFHEIKYLIALSIKQFKYLPNNIAVQFYSKLDAKYIDYNITNSYQKFTALYSKYSIATIYPEFDYKRKKELPIAQSVAIMNGVEFVAIKMHMDLLNGKSSLLSKFSQHRLQINRHQKIQSFFSTLQNFFIDLFLLIFGIFYAFNKKSRKKNDLKAATFFFLTKLSRVELMFQDQIYEQDFMIYSQCISTSKMKYKFLNNLNFISSQLKRQSILLAIHRFILNYQNQFKFFRRFRKVKIMLFMARYILVLKVISYLIVIINNIILLINSIDVNNESFDFSQPFKVLTLINFIDSLLILLIYIIKDLPLVIKLRQYDLTQGMGYFGRKYNQKTQLRKTFILILMVVTNLRLLYNLIYAFVVGLIFYNPIFASVLLLDVLAHIPSLKTLLMAIWRPKYHLFLTVVAYVILQYFFSIFMYFLFKNEANPYCQHLGSCFSFIFFTTFKSIHGFVGYLFQQKQINNINLKLTAFELFQDLYVIMIYQIIIALILAIVIDSFTVARAEKLKQEEYLKSSCIICNIERSKFNIESKIGFKGHISLNHNVFSYIDFKYSARTKCFDYLTDFELGALGDKTSSWIPDNKSRQLEHEAFTIINNRTMSLIQK